MSEGQGFAVGSTLASAGAKVRDAIASAAEATGIDFDYLLAQAKIESSLNPAARAATSSAAGLYQFTSGTWLNTMGRHGAEHGMGWVRDAMGSAAGRAQVMALRFDPQVAALMAGELAADNRADLSAHLGRQPDAAELYLAHFLGSAGANKFLDALAQDPSQSAVALMPKAAGSNRGIFFAGGAPRSVGGVMALLRDKVSSAMEATGPGSAWQQTGSAYATPAVADSWVPSGPVAREFHQNMPQDAQRPAHSMADTLASAFGAAGTAASEHVRSAYAKLSSLGL